MNVTADQILMGLWIAVAVMLVIVLYHVLFIVVDLRRTMRRINDVTEQVEDVIMKPISMADHILQWVMEMVQDQKHKRKLKHHSKE